MSSLDEVEAFLNAFGAKYKAFDITFVDASIKNANTLLLLDISPLRRRELVESMVGADYLQGPLDDTRYGTSGTWVFRKVYKQHTFTIKISMGCAESSVICIAFYPE